jgi:hypothetical protein
MSEVKSLAQKYGYVKSLVITFVLVFVLNILVRLLWAAITDAAVRTQDLLGWSALFAGFFSIFMVNIVPTQPSKKAANKHKSSKK